MLHYFQCKFADLPADELQARIVETLKFLFLSHECTGGIPVSPAPMSLGPVVERVLEEYRLAHPEYPILPVTEGDLAGHWDESRLAQLLDNLLQNALRHGVSLHFLL